jgi:surfeit locus 1 family protein
MVGVRTRMKRSDWLFAIAFLIFGVICVRLGIWQLARLQERRAWNAYIESQMDLSVLELPGTDLPFEELAYRRVVVTGEWQPEDEILLRNRSYNDQPGYHLVTPLRNSDLQWAILVDRGWIPIDSGDRDTLDEFRQSGQVRVEGILLSSVEQPSWSFLADPTLGPEDEPLRAWRVLTIERIEQQLAYTLYGYYLAQSPADGQTVQPPIPEPEIDLSEGPHLGYAIQWFSFATIAVFGGGYWLKRRVDNRQTKEAES